MPGLRPRRAGLAHASTSARASFAFVLGPGHEADGARRERQGPRLLPKPGARDDAALATRRWRSGSCCASRSQTWPRSRPRGWSRRWSPQRRWSVEDFERFVVGHPLAAPPRAAAGLGRDARTDDRSGSPTSSTTPTPTTSRSTLERRDRRRAPAAARRGRARGLGRGAGRLRDRAAVPAARPPGASTSSRTRARRARCSSASSRSQDRRARRWCASSRTCGWQRGAAEGRGRVPPARQAVPVARRDRGGRVRRASRWATWSTGTTRRSSSVYVVGRGASPRRDDLGLRSERCDGQAGTADARAGATSTRSCRSRGAAPTSRAVAGEGASERGSAQRPPAEVLYADELARLAAHDGDAPRPPGWRLTPALGACAFVLRRRSARDQRRSSSARSRSSSAAWSRWPPTAG